MKNHAQQKQELKAKKKAQRKQTFKTRLKAVGFVLLATLAVLVLVSAVFCVYMVTIGTDGLAYIAMASPLALAVAGTVLTAFYKVIETLSKK